MNSITDNDVCVFKRILPMDPALNNATSPSATEQTSVVLLEHVLCQFRDNMNITMTEIQTLKEQIAQLETRLDEEKQIRQKLNKKYLYLRRQIKNHFSTTKAHLECLDSTIQYEEKGESEEWEVKQVKHEDKLLYINRSIIIRIWHWT